MTTVNLKILADNHQELFKAEIAALLHNLAKLHGSFLLKFSGTYGYNDQRVDEASSVVHFKAGQSSISTERDRRQVVTQLLDEPNLWGNNSDGAQALSTEWKKLTRTSQRFDTICDDLNCASSAGKLSNTSSIIEALLGARNLADLLQVPGIDQYLGETEKVWLRTTKLRALTEEHSLSEILLLYWDDFHSQPGTPNDQMRVSRIDMWIDHATVLPRYLATAHGIASGVEKSTLKAKKNPPNLNLLKQSSVFGYEAKEVNNAFLDRARTRLLGLLVNCDFQNTYWRHNVFETRNEQLGLALADTRWPINDVSLWEYSSSIATLFKAAVAKALIEQHFVETSDLRWRLLSIRFDGLEYLSRAIHISDLLARRKALNAALDAVKAVIEVEYPLGNEIYRDENGSVLIVPHIEDVDPEFSLLKAPCAGEGKLGELLTMRFAAQEYAEGKKALEGEVKPVVDLSDALLGKDITLSKAKGWKNPPLQADSVRVVEWWKNPSDHADGCTVCGLRPQGHGAGNDAQKRMAIERSVCWTCLERRDDQSKGWAQTALNDFQRTIWVEEVADNNGRVALVVGRFVMDRWLDGSLIPTMQKSPSFARIQRCWRTTETFWKEIENCLPQTLENRFRGRLLLKAKDVHDLNLHSYGNYELEIPGRQLHLSVVLDESKTRLITCENVDYFLRVAALENVSELRSRLVNTEVGVFEPSGHLSRRERIETIVVDKIDLHGGQGDEERSSPFIPILASPSMFMALVPADKALRVIDHVRQKYETEMGKVRDRLAIHTGIVFAPRRTPMRALLEAGRRMLAMPEEWETWKVKGASLWDPNNPSHIKRTISFENGVSWEIPLRMGDNTTADEWYPHLLKDQQYFDVKDEEKKDHLKHARCLQPGDEVQVCPSRFDFEFLDVAGRRNEVSYEVDEHTKICSRRNIPSRPLLLEDFPRLNKLWDWMIGGEKKLTTSQLQRLEGTLTGYIADWFNGNILKASQCQTFVSFSQTVLRRAHPAWWNSLDTERQAVFSKAVSNGLLLDVLELHLHILRERPKEEAIATQPGENL